MLVGKGDPIRSATEVRILYAYTYRIANSFQIISAWPVIWERIPEGIPGMGSGGGVSYYYTDVRRAGSGDRIAGAVSNEAIGNVPWSSCGRLRCRHPFVLCHVFRRYAL